MGQDFSLVITSRQALVFLSDPGFHIIMSPNATWTLIWENSTNAGKSCYMRFQKTLYLYALNSRAQNKQTLRH